MLWKPARRSHPDHRSRRDASPLRRHCRNAQLVEAGDGVLVPVATLENLIMMKEAANRPKNREALPQLRGLRKVQEVPSSLEPPGTGSADDHSPGLTHDDEGNDFGFEI